MAPMGPIVGHGSPTGGGLYGLGLTLEGQA